MPDSTQPNPLSISELAEEISHALRHAADHLYRAGNNERLFALATNPRWYRRSADYDPSRVAFRADVAWAMRGLVEVARGVSTASFSAIALAGLPALAWLMAHVSQSATHMPLSALEALARTGDIAGALNMASLIDDRPKQARALIRIGLSAAESGATMEATSAWRQAGELLGSMPTDFFCERFEIWSYLVSAYVRAGRRIEAYDVATQLRLTFEIEETHLKGGLAECYTALGRAWGAVGDHSQALTVASRQTRPLDRARALIAAARSHRRPDPNWVNLYLGPVRDCAGQVPDTNGRTLIAQFLAWAGEPQEAERLIGPEVSTNDACRLSLAALQAGSPEPASELPNIAARQFFAIDGDAGRIELLDELTSNGDLQWCLAKLPAVSDWLHTISLTPLKNDTLGLVSLVFACTGRHEAARTLIAQLYDPDPTSDWEETDALVQLCSLYTNQFEALDWITHQVSRRSRWQQVELAYALNRAGQTEPSSSILMGSMQRIEQIPDPMPRSEVSPPIGAIVAAWHREAGRLEQAEAMLEWAVQAADADPDTLGEIVLTLAKKGWTQAAESLSLKLIDLLTPETDENATARAVGSLAEVAVLLSRSDLFEVLRAQADLLEVEWLKAEALFWMAGWRAVSGAVELGRESYLAAIATGFGEPDDSVEVAQAWAEMETHWALDIASKAVWPSTTAAALFAGVALLGGETPLRLEASLNLIDQLPVEYSRMRGICHRLLGRALHTNPDRLVTCYQTALGQQQKRDRGEIWAALGAYSLPLAAHFGTDYSTTLWQELQRVQRLVSPLAT